MKRLFLVSIFVVLSSCQFAYSQDKVEVSQSFLDDCTKAFKLVVEQRDALEKFKIERAKTDQERASADALIKGLNEFILLKDRTIGQYELLIKFQNQIIDFQKAIIDNLQKQLLKPKSLFQKIIGIMEKVVVLLAGIAIGRGVTL